MKAFKTFSFEECCKVSKRPPLDTDAEAPHRRLTTESVRNNNLEKLPPLFFPKFKKIRRRHHDSVEGDNELEREMETWKLYRDWQKTNKREGAVRDVETVNAGGFNVKIPVSPLPYCSSSSSNSIRYIDWKNNDHLNVDSSGYGTPTFDPDCIKRRPKYKRTWEEKDKHKTKHKDKDRDNDKDKEHKHKKDKKGRRKKASVGEQEKGKNLETRPPWFWTPSLTSVDDISSTESLPSNKDVSSYRGPPVSSIGSCASLASSDEMLDGKKPVKLWPEEAEEAPEEIPKAKRTALWLKKLGGDDADDGTLAAFEEPLLYRYPSDLPLCPFPYGGAWALHMKEKESEIVETQIEDEDTTTEAKIQTSPSDSFKPWQFPPTGDVTGEVTDTTSMFGENTPRPPHTSPIQVSGVWRLDGEDTARERREWQEALERDRIVDDMERQLLADSEGESSIDTHLSDTTVASRSVDWGKKDKQLTWWEFNHAYRRGRSPFSSSESWHSDEYNIDEKKLVGSDATEKSDSEDLYYAIDEEPKEPKEPSIGIVSEEAVGSLVSAPRQSSERPRDSQSLSGDSWEENAEERVRTLSTRAMERPRKATIRKSMPGSPRRTTFRYPESEPQIVEAPLPKKSSLPKKSQKRTQQLPPLRLRGAGSQNNGDSEPKTEGKNAAGDSWEDYMPPTEEWNDLYKETMKRLHFCAWGRDPDGRRPSIQIEESNILSFDTNIDIGGGDTRRSDELMNEINKLLNLRDKAGECMRRDRNCYIDVFQGEVNVVVRTARGDMLVVDVEIMRQLDLYKAEIDAIGVRRFAKKVHLLPPLTLDSIFGVFLWSSHFQAREGDVELISESEESDESDSILFSDSISTSSDEGSDEDDSDDSRKTSPASSSSSDRKGRKKKKKKRKEGSQENVVEGIEEKLAKKKFQQLIRAFGKKLDSGSSLFDFRRRGAITSKTQLDNPKFSMVESDRDQKRGSKMARQSAAISKDPELSEDTMALLHAIVSSASTGRLRNMLRAADALGARSLSCAMLRLMGRALGYNEGANLKGLLHSLTQGTWLPYYLCQTRACFEGHLRRTMDYKAPYMEEYNLSFSAGPKMTRATHRSVHLPSPRSSFSSVDSVGNEDKANKSPRPSVLEPGRYSMKTSTLRPEKAKRHLSKFKSLDAELE